MITVSKDIELSGEQLAREFGESNAEEQAEFFNKNAFLGNNWNHGCALCQIDSFVDLLDDNGKSFIEKIYRSMEGVRDGRPY